MTSHYWLFDLDNTLHHADAGIFAIINHHMTAYLAEHLQLNHTAASALRQRYWQQYGATLAGLKLHHPQIDIQDFLLASHPLELILSQLKPMSNLHQTLPALPGKKIVLSNGPIHYVQALIQAMQLQAYFQQLIGIDNINYHYKPHPRAYQTVCRQLAIHPSQCIMVDDSLANLQTAKTLGMRTVWFGQHTYPQTGIDVAVANMPALAKIGSVLL
ncbi:putative hydrolase (HAD superfamily) [Snodgrassella alvi SCGC AB-598-O02]|nr:pyrimidine 5'-nucleotidase [Snodgrassella alvi]KES09467.1 putative hydrolase (HAD superfamily) [Snodgrassella alvi SCGC AB-598-O02]